MTGTPKPLPRHFLLCMLFGLLAVSCENDESLMEEKVAPHNQDLPISILTTTYEEAGEKFKQVSSLHKLDNHIGLESHGNIQRRGDSPGIVIISEVVKVIKQGDYTSFTMLIEPKDIASNIFYNLTIEEVKGVIKMFITKYVPTEAWLENNNMPFHGQITTFRINDLQTALDRVDTPINGGGEGGGAMTYPTDCNGTVVATVIVNEIRCGCGHGVAENCTGCNISPQFPYLDYKTVYECVPNTPPPGGNPFTDPPGGTPGTTNPPGGGPGGGSGPGNTPPSPPGNDPSLTAPVGPKDGAATGPCALINKLKEDALFKLRMKNLETATNYKFEKVYTAYDNPTPTSQPTSIFKFNEFSGTIAQPQANYTYYTTIRGIMHSHYEGLLSIYSPKDLQDIYLTLKNPDVTLDFFSGLVTKAGTKYVISIADKAKFMAFGDKYLSTNRKIEDFTNKYYTEKYNIRENGNNENNEKGFVKMMTDLNAGITAFKGNSDFTVWQRLIYTPTTNQVTPVGCN